MSGLTVMIVGKRAFARIAFPLYVALVLVGYWSAVSRSSPSMCLWNIKLPQFVSFFPVDTVCRLVAFSSTRWSLDQFQPSCDVTTCTIFS